MLTITDQAQLVLDEIPAQYADPGSAGLRIALMDGHGDALQVRRVAEQEPGDQVIESRSGRVFLGPVASQRLEGRELDAGRDDRGRILFKLRAPSL